MQGRRPDDVMENSQLRDNGKAHSLSESKVKVPLQGKGCSSTQRSALSSCAQLQSGEMQRRRPISAFALPWASILHSQVTQLYAITPQQILDADDSSQALAC